MLFELRADNAQTARIVGMARADLMLFGHVVEFEPAVLAVHDALGTQDVAVVAAVQLVEHVLKSFLAELLRRLLAPGGEDVVGVVMMVALALGIVALLAVVVMVVMLVLVVLVMVMVVMMIVLMVMLILIVVMLILIVVMVMLVFMLMVVLVMLIVMMVMLMLVLGLFDLVLAAHLFKKLVAQRHLFDGGEDGLAVQLVPRSRQPRAFPARASACGKE